MSVELAQAERAVRVNGASNGHGSLLAKIDTRIPNCLGWDVLSRRNGNGYHINPEDPHCEESAACGNYKTNAQVVANALTEFNVHLLAANEINSKYQFKAEKILASARKAFDEVKFRLYADAIRTGTSLYFFLVSLVTLKIKLTAMGSH